MAPNASCRPSEICSSFCGHLPSASDPASVSKIFSSFCGRLPGASDIFSKDVRNHGLAANASRRPSRIFSSFCGQHIQLLWPAFQTSCLSFFSFCHHLPSASDPASVATCHRHLFQGRHTAILGTSLAANPSRRPSRIFSSFCGHQIQLLWPEFQTSCLSFFSFCHHLPSASDPASVATCHRHLFQGRHTAILGTSLAANASRRPSRIFSSFCGHQIQRQALQTSCLSFSSFCHHLPSASDPASVATCHRHLFQARHTAILGTSLAANASRRPSKIFSSFCGHLPGASDILSKGVRKQP